jgi:hypothetical protein
MDNDAQQQFKLNIRNEPIREKDSDAQNALSNVANTLRAVSVARVLLCTVTLTRCSKHFPHPENRARYVVVETFETQSLCQTQTLARHPRERTQFLAHRRQ